MWPFFLTFVFHSFLFLPLHSTTYAATRPLSSKVRRETDWKNRPCSLRLEAIAISIFLLSFTSGHWGVVWGKINILCTCILLVESIVCTIIPCLEFLFFMHIFYFCPRSECELLRQTCGERVVVAPNSHCQSTKYCDVTCPKDSKKMVCGSDSQFYANECEMRKSNCG